MSDPHFKVGDLVRVQEIRASRSSDAFIDALLRTSMLGIYEVAAILPDVGSEPRYRVKGIAGRFERAVRESEITAAVRNGGLAHVSSQ